jgi:hypothetical protein
MVLIVGSCAKNEDIQKLEDNINLVQCLLNEKIANLCSAVKKNNEQHSHKTESHEDKLKLLMKEMQTKLKINDFHEYRK